MIALAWAFIRGINPRILLTIALAIAAVIGWNRMTSHYIEIGRQEVRTEWIIENAEREEKENDARIAEQKHQASINESVKKGHANEIAKIHTAYATANRLRIPASACSQLTETTSAGGIDATTAATVALPPAIEQGLFDLAQEADTMLANYRALQEFVKLNGLAP